MKFLPATCLGGSSYTSLNSGTARRVSDDIT
jgi:hypothetical protein